MATKEISEGVAHKLPVDLMKALNSSPKALAAWENITPLARNEWICWTVTVKQQKTRDNHVKRVIEELNQGIRRPCCWLGCIHRPDKAMSPTQRWILYKRSEK